MRNVVWLLLTRWRPQDDADGSVLSSSPSQPVTDVLEALTADARPHELVGMAEPLALYRAGIERPAAVSSTSRRTPVLTTLIGARTGAAVAGVAIGLAATSFVAYSATRQAQTTTLTPASASAAPTPTSSSSPVGPDATGPAAHGLCTAWANHHKHQDGVQRAQDSEAMRNLARAAGGESKVAAYCAKLPTHRNGPKSDRDDAADNSSKAKPTPAGPKAKPTTKPTPRPSASGSASVPAPSGSTSPTASPTASASPSAQP